MAKRPARTIHAWRSSGTNLPGYSRPAQQPAPVAPAASVRPSVRPTAPQRPQDATTLDEALQGLLRAAAGPSPSLQFPAMAGGHGSFIALNGHQQRLPENTLVSASRAKDGTDVAFVMNDRGRIWILIGTDEGVRELVNVPPQLLHEIRRERFGA